MSDPSKNPQDAVKHADLQFAVKDLNEVFGLRQNKISGRQVLIDFIVGTVGQCIGPNPENPEENIWIDNRAGHLKPETLATYDTLSSQEAATETKEAETTQVEPPVVEPGAEAGPAEKSETEVGGSETQEAPSTECPSFGKDRDPNDPACQTCKRGEECATAVEAAKAQTKKKTEPKPPAEPRGPSATTRITQIVCDNPEIADDQIKATLTAEGIKFSASIVAVQKRDALKVINYLKETNRWPA